MSTLIVQSSSGVTLTQDVVEESLMHFTEILGKVSGIYCITNTLTYQLYIGQSQDIRRRWRDHLSGAFSRKLQGHLYSAMRKYGREVWHFSILEETNSLLEREVFWISLLNTEKGGYNRTPGGDASPMTGKTHSPEVRQKLKALQQGNTHMLGKHHTPQARKRMSAAHVGNTYRQGKTHSEGTKQQISASLTGRAQGSWYHDPLTLKHKKLLPAEVTDWVSQGWVAGRVFKSPRKPEEKSPCPMCGRLLTKGNMERHVKACSRT